MKACILGVFLTALCCMSPDAGGQGMTIPRSDAIIHVGANMLGIRPMKDSAINDFRLKIPGLYVKVSGENYVNGNTFVLVDLNMSFNYGWIQSGYARTSRLVFEYGYGKRFDNFKLSASAGLCYASAGYLNRSREKSLTENRFAPSISGQADLILFSNTYNYLALFLELSLMVNKPSRMVNQGVIGLAWKPNFKKAPKPVFTP